MREHAWVTSAIENDAVDKALILAASLRRVHTAKTLVVLTTSNVSEELREKLKDTFDLVLLLEKKGPNGLSLEDYAKVHALSLVVFKKCVYLSPDSLVLENCDDLFSKYANHSMSYIAPKGEIDTSVFLFTPNLELSRSIGLFAKNRSSGSFAEYLGACLTKEDANVAELDEKFNVSMKLKTNGALSMAYNASIVHFADIYPLEFFNEEISNFGSIEKLAVDLCLSIYMKDIKSLDSRNSKKIATSNEPIAIVGMSFRLPGGNNADEFWSLLADGRNAIIPVPPHRWTKSHSYRACKNRQVEAGFLSIPIDEIDAKFFGLSAVEAEFLDPQQRLLLEVTWEALEDAMMDPLKLEGEKAGVFVGSWIHDYKDILGRAVDVDFFRTYMGNSFASSSARISHFLGATGPSIATESGCSSAIAAIDMACNSLRNGDSSLAVVAGVNLLLHPFEAGMMEFVFSPDYRCKTFDENANGFARGEGCAVLILKRLSDAVSNDDNIWGLIRGTALSQEGPSKSLGTPTVQCESLAMELALEDAGVEPNEVDYVEAHGTGTAVGDPLEIMAIAKAYSKNRTEPLLVGSVKTNVGHTESVSGITGIIKVLLSMKNEYIPKHLNLSKLNPNINLDAIPAQIPLEAVPWPRSNDKKRIAGVSSFGISGTDGHVIIEEPPQIQRRQFNFQVERPLHIMKISAKSMESIEGLIQNYMDIFSDNEGREEEFANIAYSANIGRATFNHRAVITARNFTEAMKVLNERSFLQSEVKSSGSALCFLFTGQGSQYPNMAKQLNETSPVFKETFDQCDRILHARYGICIKDTLWKSESKDELSRTIFSQTSIFVIEYCLLRLWESWGVTPDYVIGHSLGEFAAAVAAGVLDIEDAIMLVAERSRLIDSLPSGKMLVVKAGKDVVDKAILTFQKTNPSFWLDYAALNSSEQTVLAGDSGMIEKFANFCEEKSMKTTVLASSHAFHSRHMDPILETYRQIASTVQKPRFQGRHPKFISGMEGKLIDLESIDAEYWMRHTREKVNFIGASKVIQKEGCSLFLEIGPHPVLSALVMMNNDGQSITCLTSLRRNQEDWNTILESLGKLYLSSWKGEINWKGFDMFYDRRKVQLPFYPFNRKPAWTRFEHEPVKIHALVGSLVETASNETIFQNSITLRNTSFVQDHVIGNTVVFPGAGFLEMCLAAGHATVQGLTEDNNMIRPRKPICIKSLKIASPLALHEVRVCKVQTLVALSDNDDDTDQLGYSVAVHGIAHTEIESAKWIQHASAIFLPMAAGGPLEPIDIAFLQSNWTKWESKEFYAKLPEVGLRFGPKFQSLRHGWKSESGVLASLQVPHDYKKYLIHPIIADAMLQVIMLWMNREILKKKLHVPVQIGEFIWLNEPKSLVQFVYCSASENNGVTCTLLDDTGSPLAYMCRVDFMETTAKAVEGMITQQHTPMPQLWEEVWKQSRGPMQGYLTHDAPVAEIAFTEDDYKKFGETNNIPADELKFYKNVVRYSQLSFLHSLYVLGWRPEAEKVFSVDFLQTTFSILENFKQYIHFFLRSITKGDNILLRTMNAEENMFQFLETPPSIEALEKELQSITDSIDQSREEYRLTAEAGKCLDKILIGQVLPLTILFPEDAGKPSAEKFYRSMKQQVPSRPTESKIRSHMRNGRTKSASTSCRPTYRTLEVGAGTGSFSVDVIRDIIKTTKDTELEYWYTDVSPAFFIAAEKSLADIRDSVIFKKFDMESDPLVQGLCPGYFDAIVGVEVLHVARDIKKTMLRLRSLLKPGGLIVICETIYPDERITFTFGLLDGYWQFEDKGFRKYHTTLTSTMWRETLEETSFHGVNITPLYNNVHGIITAYAAPLENTFLATLNLPPTNSWIIFGELDDFSEELCRKLENVNRKCHILRRPAAVTTQEESFMKSFFKAALENGDNIEGIIYLWSLSPNTRDQRNVSLPT